MAKQKKLTQPKTGDLPENPTIKELEEYGQPMKINKGEFTKYWYNGKTYLLIRNNSFEQWILISEQPV